MDELMETTNIGSEGQNPSPVKRLDPSSEVVISVNNTDESYIEDVLAECHKVSVRMVNHAIVVTIVFVVVLLFQAVCIWNSDRLYATYKHDSPVKAGYTGEETQYNMSGLYDNLHVVFSKWYGNEGFSIHYADAFIAALACIVITKVAAFSPAMCSCQMFIRYMVIMSTLYLIRGIFIVATVVPIASCDVLDLSQGYFKQYLHILAGYLSITRTCTDMIISGHAAGTTTLVQMFLVHNRQWQLNTIVVVLASAIYCMLIAARSHYTVDVIFGIFFAIYLYSTNLHIAEHVGRKVLANRDTEKPHVSWIYRTIAGFELVEDRVQLLFKLQQARRMVASKPEGPNVDSVAYYCNIFGIEDEIDAEGICMGFDTWTTASFRLIRRRLRGRKKKRGQL
ncbi:hypothetical protein X943_003818 [Babesia divergens]|uniref:Sphingomyelin synthase-like domain-containing protein n=1 Tax=Babesia divergens TaxID=32595 RepID=A0AAD9LEH8_BABDI|nr:hypothetical protein X943_003818 [Babesia divergens]